MNQLTLELDVEVQEWKEDPNPMVRVYGLDPKGRFRWN